MSASEDKQRLAKDYLLRKLSGEELTRLEEGFFAENELFEEIEIAEDELVDAYVNGDLSAIDRELFEKNLHVSPRVAQRVEFARLFDRAAARSTARATVGPFANEQPSLWHRLFSRGSLVPRFAWAAISVAVIIGGSALLWDWLRLRNDTKRLMADRAALEQKNQELVHQNETNSRNADRLSAELLTQEAENKKLNDELDRQITKPSRPATTLSLLLFAGNTRAAGESTIIDVPSRPALVDISLLLESDDYPSYIAVIKTVDGRLIESRSGLKTHVVRSVKAVKLRSLSTRFLPGDYIVALSGTKASGEQDPVADYSFRVNAPKPR